MEHTPPPLEPPSLNPEMPLGARLFNVFATPGEVFESIKNRIVSNANWLVPGLILIAVSWIGAWVIFSQESIQQQLREITDQAIDKQVQKQHLSEQQAEQARAIGAKFGNIGTKVGAFVVPVFAGMVAPFWWGLILWLVGAKILKGDVEYMKAVEVSGLAGMISVLEAILKVLLILVTSNIFASTSLALFVKQFNPQNPMHSMLAIVNPMTFWALSVRALGVSRLSGAGFGKAAAWVFGIWFVLTGALLGFSLGIQAMFSR